MDGARPRSPAHVVLSEVCGVLVARAVAKARPFAVVAVGTAYAVAEAVAGAGGTPHTPARVLAKRTRRLIFAEPHSAEPQLTLVPKSRQGGLVGDADTSRPLPRLTAETRRDGFDTASPPL